jgi:hypothetical protein
MGKDKFESSLRTAPAIAAALSLAGWFDRIVTFRTEVIAGDVETRPFDIEGDRDPSR